ncbi:MFS transporter [Nocardia sp. BSTN01]|uniref:MFS transporter n=1 Tax=Nocardia sp. BSTN01 TaxID=2783665 RepID=UPI001890A738|nr:MFS transporter [Nocardia sp. BSTN01]MBF4999669.1 MFS transporter [Nocardia sp. BSTN01]
MTATTTAQSSGARPRRWRRDVISGVAGNAVEYADFAMWSAFALYFTTQFFPVENQTAQLLYGAGIFAVGQIARPLGSIVFGKLADKRGRRLSLTFSVTLMAVSSFAIAAAPNYRTAGLTGAVILLLARILQGLSVGGEHGAAAAYIIESAPESRRGFASSLQYIGVTVGGLLSIIVLIVCQAVFPEGAIERWGWRLAFTFMGLVALAVFAVRRTMSETEAFRTEERRVRQAQADNPGIRADDRGSFRVLWRYRRSLLTVFALGASSTLIFQTIASYSTTYLVNTAGMSRPEATQLRLIGQVVMLFALPVFGLLSDRVGRRPMLVAGFVLSSVAVVPIFRGFGTGSYGLSLALLTLGIVAIAMMLSVMATVTASAFPTAVRTLGISLPYALAIALIGGTADVMALGLREAGQENWFFAWVVLWGAIGLVASLRVRAAAEVVSPVVTSKADPEHAR